MPNRRVVAERHRRNGSRTNCRRTPESTILKRLKKPRPEETDTPEIRLASTATSTSRRRVRAIVEPRRMQQCWTGGTVH